MPEAGERADVWPSLVWYGCFVSTASRGFILRSALPPIVKLSNQHQSTSVVRGWSQTHLLIHFISRFSETNTSINSCSSVLIGGLLGCCKCHADWNWPALHIPPIFSGFERFVLITFRGCCAGRVLHSRRVVYIFSYTRTFTWLLSEERAISSTPC